MVVDGVGTATTVTTFVAGADGGTGAGAVGTTGGTVLVEVTPALAPLVFAPRVDPLAIFTEDIRLLIEAIRCAAPDFAEAKVNVGRASVCSALAAASLVGNSAADAISGLVRAISNQAAID